MQAAAVHVGAAGRADQDPEPGRIDERDSVKIDDQRLPAVCQPEQAIPQPGHCGHVHISGDLRNHNAALTADRDRQLITHDHPPAADRRTRPADNPHVHDDSGTQLEPAALLPASAPIMPGRHESASIRVLGPTPGIVWALGTLRLKTLSR
jgi:hypothetical protein